MDFLNLPKRTDGNRTYGITSIIDLGTPCGELELFLSEYNHLIDIAKLGIGSAYITSNLHQKINIYKSYGIRPYCGGTLFEKAYLQNKLPEYLAALRKLDIEWIEVSNGTVDIPLEERVELIENLKRDFHVVGEVGSKKSADNMSVDDWREEIYQLLEAGCEYVITEGRSSGTAGIYKQNGEIKEDLIKELLRDIDSKRIIFEAPSAKQQIYFIKEIGPNVNLGNVKLKDVPVLECQRLGLRSETFDLEEHPCRLPL